MQQVGQVAPNGICELYFDFFPLPSYLCLCLFPLAASPLFPLPSSHRLHLVSAFSLHCCKDRREPGQAPGKNSGPHPHHCDSYHDSGDAKAKGGPHGFLPAPSPSSLHPRGWGSAEQANCVSQQLALLCSAVPVTSTVKLSRETGKCPAFTWPPSILPFPSGPSGKAALASPPPDHGPPSVASSSLVFLNSLKHTEGQTG